MLTMPKAVSKNAHSYEYNCIALEHGQNKRDTNIMTTMLL